MIMVAGPGAIYSHLETCVTFAQLFTTMQYSWDSQYLLCDLYNLPHSILVAILEDTVFTFHLQKEKKKQTKYPSFTPAVEIKYSDKKQLSGESIFHITIPGYTIVRKLRQEH